MTVGLYTGEGGFSALSKHPLPPFQAYRGKQPLAHPYAGIWRGFLSLPGPKDRLIACQWGTPGFDSLHPGGPVVCEGVLVRKSLKQHSGPNS